MKTNFATYLALVLTAASTSFAFTTGLSSAKPRSVLEVGYVPDGLTPAQWEKQKSQETSDKSKKRFGAFGPQSFQSRSLQSFQKELEKGTAKHLMPVMNAKNKVKNGKLKAEDVPYMQRGGSWDNSDLETATKVAWSDDDKKYDQGEPKPFWAATDWSGKANRSSPAANDSKKTKPVQQKPKVQKLFGIF